MKNLFKSLAAFQQEVPTIHKGTQGYGYSYADLPAIFDIINPLLKKHGLGFTQEIEGISLRTTIFHVESGENRTSLAEIPQNVSLAKMNAFQVLGSAITYMRRYALSAALGLITDKDTDAATPQTPPKAEDADRKPALTADGFDYLVNGKNLENLRMALSTRRMSPDQRKRLEEIATKLQVMNESLDQLTK